MDTGQANSILKSNSLSAEYINKYMTEDCSFHDLVKLINHAVVSERKNLSSKLHDDLLQAAFSAMLHCSIALKNTNNPDIKKQLELAIKSLNKLLINGKTIIGDLVPPPLEPVSLSCAIKEHARNIFEGTSIKLNMMESNPKKLPDELESTIFKIAQEALMNIIKHSMATEATVSLKISKNDIVLQIQDNGIGLPSSFQSLNKNRIGMKLLRERVEMHNGIICIQSKPQKGTTIKAVFPIDPSKKAKQIYYLREKFQNYAGFALATLFFIIFNYSIILLRNAMDTAWARSFEPSFINIFFQ